MSPTPPRRIGNTLDLTAQPVETATVAWRLQESDRHLDANLIRLAPAGEIAPHTGGEVDVLVHVVAGSGTVNDIDVTAGDLLWLPRRSRRAFRAGPDGLGYLTVHTHREPTLTIESVRRTD